MYDSRRTSYSSSRSASTTSTGSLNDDPRKQSLREMPSYRDEASKALNRRDDLKDLKRRLSSNRDLLNADHASKPWLKFRSVSKKSLEINQESGQAYAMDMREESSSRKNSAAIFSTPAQPAKIISPSAVMSARPVKYSRTNNDNFYNY